MPPTSTLIIPVENQVRELDAKLLLACVAVERGYPVVLGSRAFVHFEMQRLPRGVYLAKSMRRLSERMFGILRGLGHEIVAFDEEGLVRLIDEEYYRARLSPRAVALVSHLLAWGPDDARVFAAFPAARGVPIHVTGNPRIDMLRPELRAYLEPERRHIHERFGDFILINTNFGEVNHFIADLGEARKLAEGRAGSGGSDWLEARAHFRLRIFREFEKMLPALAEALPDQTFVLRPHPSESHENWLELTRRFERVHVINEGSVLPWLLASSGMIQNGCTTAVEAHMLDIPTLGFHPIVDERYDEALPFGLSHVCRDLDALARGVRDAAAGKLSRREDAGSRALLEGHVAATSGRFAAERMVDVLDEAGYRAALPPAPRAGRRLGAAWLNRLRAAEKRINMRRPGHRNHLSFHAHRFPELSCEDVQGRVDRLSTLLGRFRDVRVRALRPHVFRIERGRGGGD